jgi:delta(3,5)-delta(2,4)-dienoyl-CoA isomerase
MAESKYHQFKLYKVSFPDEYVLHVQFDRPRNLNAVNPESYRQYRQIFEIAEHDPDVRVIVLSGVGRAFCAGLDVEGAQQMFSKAEDVSDVSRRGLYLYRALKEFQRAINKPFEINKRKYNRFPVTVWKF